MARSVPAQSAPECSSPCRRPFRSTPPPKRELVELELDGVPARRIFVTRSAADRIHQRPLVPLHHFVGKIENGARYLLACAEGFHEHHGLMVRLRVQQLEGEQLRVRIGQARERDNRLDRMDLAAQVLAQRLLVTGRTLLRSAVVAVEESARALEVLEYAQVVVAYLPGVRHEQAERIGLRHGPSLAHEPPAGNLSRRASAPQSAAPRDRMNPLPLVASLKRN